MRLNRFLLCAALLAPVSGDAQLSGPEFRVSTFSSGSQVEPHVAVLPGRFVIVWQGQGTMSDGNPGYGILARRFTASGVPIAEGLVAGQIQTEPRIAAGDGDFLIVWIQPFGQTLEYDVLGRRTHHVGGQRSVGAVARRR